MPVKYQVVKFRNGVLYPIREYDEKSRACGFADRFNRFLLGNDGPLCRALLVMFQGELVRGPANLNGEMI